ncbi:uncharacterized protein LOC102719510 isoform X2 [Oryza brachyantha]|uniref:uncharacterized protein LOC102719510 isoform X2 n=1 Tax=Oryza brachyantha TaxID=4533 RepID=UPI001ADBA353|nr:uncharacterized protein LOC102719510 isoform X2 [Oryza brachyantha]
MPRKPRASTRAARPPPPSPPPSPSPSPRPAESGESHAPAAVSGRWTRSRARALGLDTAEHPRAGGGGGAPAAAPPTTKSSSTGMTLASRPLPLRYPPYPTLPPGKRPTRKHADAVLKWIDERRRVAKLSKQQAQRKDIPTLRDDPEHSEPLTDDAVVKPPYKAMVRRVARSVVGVSSKIPDGELISQCTGVIISWEGTTKRAKILTAAAAVCDFRGELHNPTLKVPSFGPGAYFGQDIFSLGRDENMSLGVSHGTILWLDYPVLLRNHYMFLSCDIPEGGSGGPVIDHGGDIIAIAFDINPGPVVTSINTIMTCIAMWDQFRRVSRPILGMQLKSVELLDVSRQEELSIDYDITGGFIVKQVIVESAAEKLGIRRGDVIVFQDVCCSTLPQLEDYLLSLGWRYLQGMHSTTDLKVEVHNLFDSYRESITFPVQFSDASKQVY